MSADAVRLSGWIHRKRDHGGVLFVDLRDHYGLTQIVARAGSEPLAIARASARRIGGDGRPARSSPAAPKRPTRTCRPARSSSSPTTVTVQSAAEELPLPVAGEADYPEDIRLRYRYLDLRRERLHRNIVLRSQVISLDPAADDRAGLHRVPDADPDRVEPRGRARLSRPEPRPSRQVLRASAGAADVQAIDHGRRLRPLFPDRALLPRRGCPRRPLARANSTSSISR